MPLLPFRRLRPLIYLPVRAARLIRRTVSSCSFITLHHAYFIGTCLVFSGIFYGISTPRGSVSYINSLFLVVSAMTLTGLNTIDLSTVNTVQQIILFFLILIGSGIFVSAFVVHVRKRAFEHRFVHIEALRWQKRRHRRASTSHRVPSREGPLPPPPERKSHVSDPSQSSTNNEKGESSDQGKNSTPQANTDAHDATVNQERQRSDENATLSTQTPVRMDENNASHGLNTRIRFKPPFDPPRDLHLIPSHGVGAHSGGDIRSRSGSLSTTRRPSQVDDLADSTAPHIGKKFLLPSLSRNSQFYHLTEKERERLGGYEYRAVRLLSWLVPVYFILFQLLGCLGLGAYVANNRPDTALQNGLNPWWVGSFFAVSAFNNSGMSLLDANMVAFQTSIYMLLTMSLLILAGNTCYPIFLRLVVWTLFKLMPKGEKWHDHRMTLQFLLKHPRRCYTTLFPSRHTWWLLFAVFTLNSIDWVAFELLNLGQQAIDSIPANIRVLDGLFQAFAVRSGGFYVVPISSTRISLQVLYVIMMYISVYPVVITMRNTNVYEERSLGIYSDDPDYRDKQEASEKRFLDRFFRGRSPFDATTQYFVRHQLRAQLSHDIWGIVLAIFLIVCFEAGSFEREPTVFSVFNIIFETVSAYGCVGISVGLPNESYSFSGAWRTWSKLILCAVMLRGRHRGLPVAIDKAVLLPREEVDAAEEDDALIREERSVSRGRAV